MPSVDADLHGYYAARAPYYDDVYLKPERAKDIAFLSQYLPSRFEGRSVLEVACGTGFWTQYIAPSAERVVATDGTAEPLSHARARPGVHNVVFRKEDAYSLPHDLGMFNAAFAGLWFSHVPVQSRGHFFASLHPRLEPGSRVVMIDNNEVQLKDFAIAETDAHGNTYQHRQLRDGSVHRVLKNFPTEQELRIALCSTATSFLYRQLQNFWLIEYEI